MSPSYAEEIPELPEPEGSVLKNHLKQVRELVLTSSYFLLMFFFF